MRWLRDRIGDAVVAALGLAVLVVGLRAVAGVAAALGPWLGTGWAALAGLVLAAPVVALAWTLVVDGPRATAALVRARRGRR